MHPVTLSLIDEGEVQTGIAGVVVSHKGDVGNMLRASSQQEQEQSSHYCVGRRASSRYAHFISGENMRMR